MRRRKEAWLLFFFLFQLAGASFGAECSFIDLNSLLGWQMGLAAEDVLPYQLLGIKSELLCAARSPNGSYVFVTFVDSGRRPPLSFEELDAMVTRETFASWNPIDYAKKPIMLRVEGETTKALWVSVVYPQTGYGMVRFRKVYIPATFICGSGSQVRFLNHMYVVSYWGPRDLQKDVNAYERLLQNLTSPSPGCNAVDAEVFMEQRAIHEEAKKLAAQIGGGQGLGETRSSKPESSPKAVREEPAERSRKETSWRATETFLRALDDAVSKQTVDSLAEVSRTWSGTVVGDMARSFLSVYQTKAASMAVQRLLAEAPASPEGKMAVTSVLLAGVNNCDENVTEQALTWLKNHGIEACSLEPKTLRVLLEAAASTTWKLPPALEDYLGLPSGADEGATCLSRLGLQEVNGVGVQIRLRRGLAKGLPKDLPKAGAFVIEDGDLYLVRPIRGSDGELQRIDSLLDVASAWTR